MSMMMAGPSDYVLEIKNLYYNGHVEPQTWLKQLTGTTRTGMILRDVSFEVGSSNMMAILGSKGSGKKALLDIIANRAPGHKKGYVLLNGVNVNRRLFESTCAYITPQSDHYVLTPGLTPMQMLYYESCLSLKVESSLRKIRIRQTLSDVALSTVANVRVELLTESEKRRVAIAIKLIKDPVVVLADEPAWGLDALNTYFVISILSNFAKKYNRVVILTMEKPRSDIFPFLDRVTYLCLGDVVYSGNTRIMLDYFRNIGFPCPEIENALIYYLCLSTVDRRSHEKFIESSNQIALLVEKFKIEGHAYRKDDASGFETQSRSGFVSNPPLHSFGKPPFFSRMSAIVLREYTRTFLFNKIGATNFFFHMLLLPFLFFLLWIVDFGIQQSPSQTIFVTYNGIILNTLSITTVSAILSTVITFPQSRTLYYQESREGAYNGATFVVSSTIACLPFTLLSTLIASRILYQIIVELSTPNIAFNHTWLQLFAVLLSISLACQQHAMTVMLFIKSRVVSFLLSCTILTALIVLSSGTLRALRALPNWLFYLSYITQTRYGGAYLNEKLFSSLDHVPSIDGRSNCGFSDFGSLCRYVNGSHYLIDRYPNMSDLNLYLNFGITFVFFALGLAFNLIFYSVPLFRILKNKFRNS